MSNNDSLKKWADELQKKEKILQDKEKELETKLKKQTLSDVPPPPKTRLGHRYFYLIIFLYNILHQINAG